MGITHENGFYKVSPFEAEQSRSSIDILQLMVEGDDSKNDICDSVRVIDFFHQGMNDRREN